MKPQINGIISEIYKEAGEQVKENEIIAKLKVIPDMASLSSAESRVRLADINLKQAQTYDKDLVSAEEYDQVVQAPSRPGRSALPQENLEVIRDGVSSTNATESSTSSAPPSPDSSLTSPVSRQLGDPGQHHE